MNDKNCEANKKQESLSDSNSTISIIKGDAQSMEKVYLVSNKENEFKIDSVWSSERKANLRASALNYESLNNGGDPLRWNVKRYVVSK
jgi:hypothetical protein